nr:unnamed protein product [Callosobruchus chinensis]
MEHYDTKLFWSEVLNYRNGDDQPFKELAEFCLELLVLPLSNAEVERLFSAMNIIKTILSIETGLNRYVKCCHSYNIPVNVLEKIKTKEIYEGLTLDDDDLKEKLILGKILKAQLVSVCKNCGCLNCPHGRPTMRHLINLDLISSIDKT